VATQLIDVKLFTVHDARTVFWMVKLDTVLPHLIPLLGGTDGRGSHLASTVPMAA